MYNAFGERMKVSELLRKMYELKRLGKKTKVGFYNHTGRTKVEDQHNIDIIRQNPVHIEKSESEILERLIYVMIKLNE